MEPVKPDANQPLKPAAVAGASAVATPNASPSTSSSTKLTSASAGASNEANEKVDTQKPAAVPEDELEYDEKDPPSLIGKVVHVLWGTGRWYSGRVEQYDPKDNTHYVVYDDGDRK
ncbi:MAG TPA: hypothetical protein V6C97_10460 [Oculatellaceae cyanobacterium]